MDEIKLQQLKEIFGILPKARISVTSVSNGWNIRIHKPKVVRKYKSDGSEMSFTDILINAGIDMNKCMKCGVNTYCHPHHIIPKSAGGRDDIDNGISLCFDCHVGKNGIHLCEWKIEEVVSLAQLEALRRRYEK